MTPETAATELRVNAARLMSVATSLRLVCENYPDLAPHLAWLRETADGSADRLHELARAVLAPTHVAPTRYTAPALAPVPVSKRGAWWE